MTVIRHDNHNIDKLKRLKFSLIITGFGVVIEFVGGILSNSFALLSDAGHMFTHIFALGMSYFAVLLSQQPVSKKRTYGLFRAEVLAAFVNGIFLILIAFYLVYEAFWRFIHPEPINITEMLLVATVGFIINGVTAFLFAKTLSHDLNTKSAFLHEIGDLVSSIAVVGSGIIILYTKNYIFDALLAIFISLLIIVWAVRLLIESGHILLEATPKHLDVDVIVEAIKKGVPGVYEVHHLHIWTITSSFYALTAHIVIEDCRLSATNEVLDKINVLLKERFHIGHTNLQFECLIKKLDLPSV